MIFAMSLGQSVCFISASSTFILRQRQIDIHLLAPPLGGWALRHWLVHICHTDTGIFAHGNWVTSWPLYLCPCLWCGQHYKLWSYGTAAATTWDTSFSSIFHQWCSCIHSQSLYALQLLPHHLLNSTCSHTLLALSLCFPQMHGPSHGDGSWLTLK